MRLVPLLLALTLLTGCSLFQPSPAQDGPLVKQTVSDLLNAFAAADYDAFADKVDTDFHWDSCSKRCLVDKVKAAREKRSTVRIDGLQTTLHYDGNATWSVNGTVVLESTYAGSSDVVKETAQFSWVLQKESGKYGLLEMKEDWTI